jgi:hypothetical protein
MARTVVPLLLALAACAAAASSSSSPTGALLDASFVWAPPSSPPASPNTFAAFRADIPVPSTSSPPSTASLFADSRFVLFVNGQEAARGPSRFHPSAPQYDSVDITPYLPSPLPPPGTPYNVTLALLVLSYASCQPFLWQSVTPGLGGGPDPNPMTEACWTTWPGSPTPSGRMMNHLPGLSLVLSAADGTVLATTRSAGWMATTTTRYAAPPGVWGSLPDVIDARVDDFAWRAPGYVPAAPRWGAAAPVNSSWGPLAPRSIPLLTNVPLALTLVRGPGSALPAPPSLRSPASPRTPSSPLSSPFPLTLADGETAVFSLPPPGGQVRVSALLTTSTPGANLTVLYYQRLLNGTTPSASWGDGTTFTAAGTGSPEYLLSFDTWGAAYVTATAAGASVTLLEINATSSLYPYTPYAALDAGAGAPPDAAFFSTYLAASAFTAAVVSEDAFEDCAGRERAEWVGDAVYSTSFLARATLVTCEASPPAKATVVPLALPFPPASAATTPLPAFIRGPGALSSSSRAAGSSACPPSTTPVWGDTRLHAALLRRAALSTLARFPTFNVLKAHTTSERNDFNGYIEDYCAGWVSSVRDATEAGAAAADPGLLAAVWPVVRSTLNGFLAARTESGLVLGREFMGVGNPVGYSVTQGTTLNAVVLKALADGAWVARLLGKDADAAGWDAAALALQQSMLDTLFDAASGTFLAAVDADGTQRGPSALAAFVAVSTGVFSAPVPQPARLASTLAWLLSPSGGGGAVPALTCPYQSAWLLRALYDRGAEAVVDGGLVVTGGVPGIDAAAGDVIALRFPDVLVPDTATTTEMFGGGDFQHQMGATAALFLPTRVLGVRAVQPATNLDLLVEPHLGRLMQASGRAASELGPAEVGWTMTGGTWGPGAARAVSVGLNFTLGALPALPGQPPAGTFSVTVALPLADVNTPPPAGAGVLDAVSLTIGNGGPANVNVGAVLAAGGALPQNAGTLSLDAGGWYLRWTLPRAPAVVGTTVEVVASLSC